MSWVSVEYLQRIAALDKDHTAKRGDSRMARELLKAREVVEALRNTNVHIGTDGPLMDALAAYDATEDGE